MSNVIHSNGTMMTEEFVEQEFLTIKFEEYAENEPLAHWKFCPAQKRQCISFGLNQDDVSSNKELIAKDNSDGFLYKGQPSDDQLNKYYLASRKGDKLFLKPVTIFEMSPNVTYPETELGDSTTLTPAEQFEELKEKFGSRKSKKYLDEKKKHAINYNPEDADKVELKEPCRNIEHRDLDATEVQFLPPRKEDAISVSEVYDVNDFVPPELVNLIKANLSERVTEIKSDFVKNMLTINNTTEKQVLAVYLDLLITMLQFRVPQYKQADPLLNMEYNDVKLHEYLYEKFITLIAGRRQKASINDKQKDQMLIHVFLLTLIMINYGTISCEKMQTALKIPLKHLRKISQVIGCYEESQKNLITGINERVFVLKLPLNAYNRGKLRTKPKTRL